MGICQGAPDTDEARNLARTNAKINRELKAHAKQHEDGIKILLLGAGQTGKSTFCKQLRIKYGAAFIDADRQMAKPRIISFVGNACRDVLLMCSQKGLNFVPEEHADVLRYLLEDRSKPFRDMAPDTAASLTKLWEDPCFQTVIQNGEVSSSDTLGYFIARLPAISSPDYVPSDDDMILVRTMTTGVHETKFMYNDRAMIVVDCGGQRSERRKWMHCFETVSLLIFFAPLSEYNQYLIEDPRINRMSESLRLFQELVDYEPLKGIPIVLLFNKDDLFRAKIDRVPIQPYFPEYSGKLGYHAGREYLQRKFFAKAGDRTSFYHHILSTIDSAAVELVWTDLIHHFWMQALREGGMVI